PRISDWGPATGAPLAFAAAPSRAYPSSFDATLFGALAAQTGGTSTVVLDTQPVSPDASLIDSDGDGIPDFRDLCDAPGCVDGDRDGIPDVIDDCPFTLEDGNGPDPGDGCPDGDGDGIPDDSDQCRNKLEDYVPPKPTDGCPKPQLAAAPATSGA